MNIPKERILLVENDPEISDLISRQTLQPLGYRVEVVGAAPAAIQEALRFSPDVVMANLSLPGLSGKDLLVALAAQGLDVPIVVIAPKGMEGDVVQAFRLGASDFLSWPVREAEVVSAVEHVLKQVRARREREMLARQLNQTNLELQHRVRELTTLFAIGKAVITATDPQSLFNKIMEGATFVSEADSGWLLVRDEKVKTFTLKATRNVPEDIHARLNQTFDDGLSSLVALSGESLSIHGDPLKRFKISRLGKSTLVVPVKVKKDVVGLLVVVRKEAQPFSASQQALLEAVADYASISLVNSRLFKALEDRLRVLQSSADHAGIGGRIQDDTVQQINHELREPLRAIKGNVDMLLGNTMGKLNVEQTNAMSVIQEKLKTIFQIAESIEEQKQPSSDTDRNLANLNDLAREAVSRYQKIARQNAADLMLELPSKNLVARADPNHIAKVLDSLLSNAIKYSPQGGQITVRVERTGDNLVHVTVQDHGRGIGAQHLAHLFESSYRVEGTPSGRYGGIGINLPLVKEIINAHGGKVWAESKSSEGSTFHFTLPLLGGQ
ncbi:MAG: response regulator [Anaerolineales bacterium]|nr:response regulator [Anaerolineales bacterium]